MTTPIFLEGNFCLKDVSAKRREILVQLEKLPSHSRIILDCSRLEAIDAVGVALLLEILKKVTKRHGELLLSKVPKTLWEVLSLYHLEGVFHETN